jgi:hypothetical protein
LTLLFLGLAVAVAGVLALVLVPRYLLKSAQDRLAGATIAREGETFKLLTRADLVAGRYRRVPGVLGLKEEELQFSGLFGEAVQLPTSNIQKIVTGARLASGRILTGLEVLRISRSDGLDHEFVLSPASAAAWRSHLGLWAMKERVATAERVEPGR